MKYLECLRRDLDVALAVAQTAPEISRRVLKTVLMMHQKKRLKLSHEIKRVICPCYMVMLPSVTCESRLVKEKEGHFIWRRCYFCGDRRQIRVLSQRKDFNGEEAAAEQTGEESGQVRANKRKAKREAKNRQKKAKKETA